MFAQVSQFAKVLSLRGLLNEERPVLFNLSTKLYSKRRRRFAVQIDANIEIVSYSLPNRADACD